MTSSSEIPRNPATCRKALGKKCHLGRRSRPQAYASPACSIFHVCYSVSYIRRNRDIETPRLSLRFCKVSINKNISICRTQATHDMFEVIHTCAHTCAERLVAHVNATASSTHEAQLDIMDWTWRVAQDIIGRVAFDHDFGCGETENARVIHQTWMNHVNAGFHWTGALVSGIDSQMIEFICTDTGL